MYIVTDDKGWHAALKDTPGVFMYKELKSLLTEISRKQEDLYKQIVSFVSEKIPPLKECATDWLLDQDWYFAVDELEMCVECDEINDVNVEEINLILDAIEYIDNREGYAVATLSGKAKLKIGFSYIDHAEEIYDREDHVWYNTIYGDGITEIDVSINLSVSVIFPNDRNDMFEFDSPDFDELDARTIVTIDYELTECKEDLRRPYFDICPGCGQKIGLHNDGGNGFCTDCAPEH